MKLYTFIGVCVAAYALIHLFLIPEADRKWKAARTLAQIALITYSAVVLGMWLWELWE